MSLSLLLLEIASISQGFKDGKAGREPSVIMLAAGYREKYLEAFAQGQKARDSESLRIAARRI